MGWGYFGFRPYVSVAQRQANARKELEKLKKKGQIITPVTIQGRTITSTFWGMSWCKNLEAYSDFSNRLPRGRTYVRNGSVVDLQIGPGLVTALVSGSSMYEVKIKIAPTDTGCWKGICTRCAGKIGSLIELLQGKLSSGVMEVMTRQDGGLFPSPGDIEMSCSCPDWAGMCKHVAATLYGVGARLDSQPQILFTLRQVDHLELIARAADAPALTVGSGEKTLADDALGDVFGIDIDAAPAAEPVSIEVKTGSSKKVAGKPSAGKGQVQALKTAKAANRPVEVLKTAKTAKRQIEVPKTAKTATTKRQVQAKKTATMEAKSASIAGVGSEIRAMLIVSSKRPSKPASKGASKAASKKTSRGRGN